MTETKDPSGLKAARTAKKQWERCRQENLGRSRDRKRLAAQCSRDTRVYKDIAAASVAFLAERKDVGRAYFCRGQKINWIEVRLAPVWTHCQDVFPERVMPGYRFAYLRNEFLPVAI